MSHEIGKHHHTGEGVKLIAIPVAFVEQMIPGAAERENAEKAIDSEGPANQQVFNALLLNRLHQLIHVIEQKTTTKFSLQEGYELIKIKDGWDKPLPVTVPISVGTPLEKKQIADVLAHAPEHEALVYAMCMQAIEWSIVALAPTADPKISAKN